MAVIDTPFSRAAALLGQTIKQTAGVRGVYSRGNASTEEIIGTPARIATAGDVVEGVAALDIDSGWIFTAEDLKFEEMELFDRYDQEILDRFGVNLALRVGGAGSQITPLEGDVWTYTRLDGRTAVYRVLPPYQGEYCWNRMDPHGDLIRVFTRYRDTTSA